jgi:hypothetical protein
VWLARNEVSRHTGKRDGEIVEALEFGIWKGNSVKNQRDLLTSVEAPGELEVFAETELEGARDFVGILFTGERKNPGKVFGLSALHPNRCRLRSP